MKNGLTTLLFFLAVTLSTAQEVSDCDMMIRAILGNHYHFYTLSDEQNDKFCELYKSIKAESNDVRGQNFDDEMDSIQDKLWSQEDQLSEIFTRQQLMTIKSRRHVFSRDRKIQEEKRSAYNRTYMRIETFKQNTVVPVVKEQRVKLDQYILDEDKIEIVKLKSDIQLYNKKRQEYHQLLDSYFPKLKKGQKVIPEERKQRNIAFNKLINSEDFKKLTEEQYSIEERKQRLVSTYNNEVTDLMDEISSQRSTWEDKIMRYYKEFYREDPLRNYDEASFMKRYEGEHRIQKIDHESSVFKAHFILDDYAIDETTHENDLQFNHKVFIFPNPASTTQSLTFTTKQNGVVKVDVLDQSGKFVKQLLNEYKTAGTHKLEVDLSNLSDNVCFYIITSPDGMSASKILIHK